MALRTVKRGAKLNAKLDDICALFVTLSELGSVMMEIVTNALTDTQWYRSMFGEPPFSGPNSGSPFSGPNSGFSGPSSPFSGPNTNQLIGNTNQLIANTNQNQLIARSYTLYRSAVRRACAVQRIAESYRRFVLVHHECALDELTFWLIRYMLHQPLINLLLGYLPNDTYKLAFTRAFIQHYALFAKSLAKALHQS